MLGLGLLELDVEAQKESVGFGDFLLKVVVFLDHLGLEVGEVLIGEHFVLRELLSGSFEVGNKSINHAEGLGSELNDVFSGLDDSGGFELLELSSGVVDVSASDFGGGSSSGGSVGVGGSVEGVGGGGLEGLHVFHELDEDVSVFVIKEMGESGHFFDESSGGELVGLSGVLEPVVEVGD